MPAIELRRRPVERVWGRTDLPAPFEGLAGSGRPIGEIWFEAPAGEPELLVKYLFTSQPLSVQVHPDAGEAAKRGLRSGKDEAWLIVEAEAKAAIGLGLGEPVDRDALRAAALDGSVERLLVRRPVRPGDILYSPAGTVHAIGAGLSLIEVQQNCDVTYRLYDHGRDRPLQVDDAVAAARLTPSPPMREPRRLGEGRSVHVEGGHFVLERWSGRRSVAVDAAAGAVLLIPVASSGEVDGRRLGAGTVWMVEDEAELSLSADSDLLVAYGGGKARTEAFATSS